MPKDEIMQLHQATHLVNLQISSDSDSSIPSIGVVLGPMNFRIASQMISFILGTYSRYIDF